MNFAVERIDYWIADGEVIALCTEDSEDARFSKVQWSNYEEAREHDREENHCLADEDGEQELPVDSLPFQLGQREEDERRQRKRSNISVEAPCTLISDDVEPRGDVTANKLKYSVMTTFKRRMITTKCGRESKTNRDIEVITSETIHTCVRDGFLTF